MQEFEEICDKKTETESGYLRGTFLTSFSFALAVFRIIYQVSQNSFVLTNFTINDYT